MDKPSDMDVTEFCRFNGHCDHLACKMRRREDERRAVFEEIFKALPELSDEEKALRALGPQPPTWWQRL